MQVGPDWETLIDRQIREAMEDGQFDNLPHQGEPLPNDDNPYAGELGLAFHVLLNAGVAPPWIEADKEVRELLGRRDAILARAATGTRTVRPRPKPRPGRARGARAPHQRVHRAGQRPGADGSPAAPAADARRRARPLRRGLPPIGDPGQPRRTPVPRGSYAFR